MGVKNVKRWKGCGSKKLWRNSEGKGSVHSSTTRQRWCRCPFGAWGRTGNVDKEYKDTPCSQAFDTGMTVILNVSPCQVLHNAWQVTLVLFWLIIFIILKPQKVKFCLLKKCQRLQLFSHMMDSIFVHSFSFFACDPWIVNTTCQSVKMTFFWLLQFSFKPQERKEQVRLVFNKQVMPVFA